MMKYKYYTAATAVLYGTCTTTGTTVQYQSTAILFCTLSVRTYSTVL